MSLVDRDNTSQQYSSYRAVGSNQESLQAVESETVHVVVRDSDSVVASDGESVTHP